MSFFEHIQRHTKAILFTAFLLLVGGVATWLNLPVGLFPDITFPRIVVLVDNGDQPAERVMTEITKPLEAAISSVPGTRVIRSVTSRGSAEINVFLD